MSITRPSDRIGCEIACLAHDRIGA